MSESTPMRMAQSPELEIIDFSLRAPRVGMVCLCLPVLGFAGACWWLLRFERMVATRDVAWNPASWRLAAGAALAHATILLHLLAGFVVVVGVMGTS